MELLQTMILTFTRITFNTTDTCGRKWYYTVGTELKAKPKLIYLHANLSGYLDNTVLFDTATIQLLLHVMLLFLGHFGYLKLKMLHIALAKRSVFVFVCVSRVHTLWWSLPAGMVFPPSKSPLVCQATITKPRCLLSPASSPWRTMELTSPTGQPV